ncbi:MAG: DUF3576 domain-containing protein [Candidatus Paracaedibacteraceae bacterium]|nr:DUF3576 domain-containing protein [Candidatus Paracaedibacteraceae bacterium]
MLTNKIILGLSVVSLLSACSGFRDKNAPDEKAPMDSEDRRKYTFGSVVGDETLVFGGSRKKTAGVSGSGMSVNAYLWQASLDALKFMPLTSTDANGGVIVTDWYSEAQKSNERVKVTLYIRGLELRVEAIQAVVQKQVLRNGQWVNLDQTDNLAATNLENIILTKARNMRIQSK